MEINFLNSLTVLRVICIVPTGLFWVFITLLGLGLMGPYRILGPLIFHPFGNLIFKDPVKKRVPLKEG